MLLLADQVGEGFAAIIPDGTKLGLALLDGCARRGQALPAGFDCIAGGVDPGDGVLGRTDLFGRFLAEALHTFDDVRLIVVDPPEVIRPRSEIVHPVRVEENLDLVDLTVLVDEDQKALEVVRSGTQMLFRSGQRRALLGQQFAGATPAQLPSRRALRSPQARGCATHRPSQGPRLRPRSHRRARPGCALVAPAPFRAESERCSPVHPRERARRLPRTPRWP